MHLLNAFGAPFTIWWVSGVVFLIFGYICLRLKFGGAVDSDEKMAEEKRVTGELDAEK